MSHGCIRRDDLRRDIRVGNTTLHSLMQGENHSVEKYMTLLESILSENNLECDLSSFSGALEAMWEYPKSDIVLAWKNPQTEELREIGAFLREKKEDW